MKAYHLFLMVGYFGVVSGSIYTFLACADRELAATTAVPAPKNPPVSEQAKYRDDALPEDQVADLRRATALLRNEVVMLRSQVKQLANSVTPLSMPGFGVSTAQTSATELGSVSELPEDIDVFVQDLEASFIVEEQNAAERVAQRFDTIESEFQRQYTDANWFAQAIGEIHFTLEAEEFAGTETVGVDCRFSLCRIEVLHDTQEAQDVFAVRFPNAIGEILPRLVMRHEDEGDGLSNSIVFLARDGYRIPR